MKIRHIARIVVASVMFVGCMTVTSVAFVPRQNRLAARYSADMSRTEDGKTNDIRLPRVNQKRGKFFPPIGATGTTGIAETYFSEKSTID